MRNPFDATGTIGSKPCEKSLNKILAEINNPGLTGRILKCFFRCKDGLKALAEMPNKHWANFFVVTLRERCEKSIENITKVKVRGVAYQPRKVDGPTMEAVTSHSMCCLHAYFAEFRDKQNGKKEVA
jgi:hypothetical protein